MLHIYGLYNLTEGFISHFFSLQRKDTHIRVSFPIVCLVLAEARSSNDD